MGRGKPAPTLDCVVAFIFQRPLTHGLRMKATTRRVSDD
jgi:hypothetical protein